MRLEPVKIRIDDDKNGRRPSEPPPGRGLLEFFQDTVSSVTESMRRDARDQITKVIHDVDRMKPDVNDTAAYDAYRDMSDHLAKIRDDIVNGGWKGASAARRVLSEFKDYASHSREERTQMLPRLQNLMP